MVERNHEDLIKIGFKKRYGGRLWMLFEKGYCFFFILADLIDKVLLGGEIFFVADFLNKGDIDFFSVNIFMEIQKIHFHIHAPVLIKRRPAPDVSQAMIFFIF